MLLKAEYFPTWFSLSWVRTPLFTLLMATDMTAEMKASIAKQADDFTLEDVDDGSIERTQVMVSAVIAKPKMKEKLLQRPPYRFIHDIVFNIMRATGVYLTQFTESESQAKGHHKYARKVVLNKLFKLVRIELECDLEISTDKVIAGKECDKTRRFLQLFVLATTPSRQLRRIQACQRQWLRIIWREDFPQPVQPVQGALGQLLDFFAVYPGLRCLVGGLVTSYVKIVPHGRFPSVTT